MYEDFREESLLCETGAATQPYYLGVKENTVLEFLPKCTKSDRQALQHCSHRAGFSFEDAHGSNRLVRSVVTALYEPPKACRQAYLLGPYTQLGSLILDWEKRLAGNELRNSHGGIRLTACNRPQEVSRLWKICVVGAQILPKPQIGKVDGNTIEVSTEQNGSDLTLVVD
ncbi:hypothetical protein DOTSEDRAFT_81099 [Dothistroma septosporum NZE10]|uniref:Uncharacterized protein n=1 Tax=Dothistroma septosporum (strain NZE10 / CBS 128990) TaxID=675120 RepID=N1PIA0_DOTSN|nr:hypothetical protein DOTSEDRAFT_81099 [Dothistroma septosporum NZE10]